MTVAVLSAFNPHEFSEATVRAVATGRETNLKEILAAVRSNLQSQTIQHLILSAPRGYGKSFMMRHIQIEVEGIAREEVLPLSVVLMPEEMPHVKEPETLIRELTRALSGGAAGEAELSWHEDDGAVWETAAETLNQTIRQKVGARGLFVALVENFDVLLRRAFPKEVQASRLRSLLTEQDSRLMLIAASASGAFDRDYNNRLFQAFKEVTLEPWSLEDCLAFFDRQRIDAGKLPLDDAAKARATSVASFIGGTPRLATLLGDALFDEDVLHAADLLQKLVDELTPYYKERIEALPGRSQKLLDALLRGGEPATQSEIARRVNANSQAAIAGPFNDLVKERIVIGEKAPDSAEVLYRVADRVFAHYYRRRVIDHGRAGCPLEALVDLLAEYFSPEEKQTKAAEFAQRGRIEEARLMARLHDVDQGAGKGSRFWILDDLKHRYIPQRLIPFASDIAANHLHVIADLAGRSKIDEAYNEINAAFLAARPEDRVLLLLARSALDEYEGIDGGLAAANQAVAIAEQLEDQNLDIISRLARVWSLKTLSRSNEAFDSSMRLAEQARIAGHGYARAMALRYGAYSLEKLGRYVEALSLARQAVEVAKEIGDTREESIALRSVASVLGELKRHEEALLCAKQSADLAKVARDMPEEAKALRHYAFSLGELKRHEEAVSAAKQSADLAKRTGNAYDQAVALRFAAYSLEELGRYEDALLAAEQSADLAKTTGSALEEAIALRQAASNLGQINRHEDAILVGRRAALIANKAADLAEEAVALNKVAFSLGQLERHEEALSVARQFVDLAKKAGDKAFEANAVRSLILYLSSAEEHVAAIDAIATTAIMRDARSSEEEDELLHIASEMAAARAAASLADAANLERLHGLLRAAAINLDFEGQRRICLQFWMEGFTKEAIRRVQQSDTLDAWAAGMELCFPQLFGSEISRLRDTARYHASGRDRSALVRLEPDIARTLETMFPPIERALTKKKKKGTKPSRRKR
jgi:tetratricopeptide (TPR) repeat protein